MNQGHKRKRIRHKPSLRLKLKLTTRVAIAASLTAIIISLGLFLYINFIHIENSKAAGTVRIIDNAVSKTELDVKSAVESPLEKQPASRNNPGAENKRKAVLLTNE